MITLELMESELQFVLVGVVERVKNLTQPKNIDFSPKIVLSCSPKGEFEYKITPGA